MIVSELQYFPPIIFFSTLYKDSYVILDTYDIYRKMSFRNRCLITGAEGIISLSVPLINGRSQRIPMKDVLISYSEDWQLKHFKSIQSAYNRSPFFEYYRDELKDIYREPVNSLSEWNLKCLYWVRKRLGWAGEIRLSERVDISIGPEMSDRRNQILPKNYMLHNPVKYQQVFEERTGFIPNLSILDLLFNTGPRAGKLLNDVEEN